MDTMPLPKGENIYETECPILYAMELIGQKWKLPFLWCIADAENQTLRYRELERKVVGITATMLTKCLRELESDGLVSRTVHPTIPPAIFIVSDFRNTGERGIIQKRNMGKRKRA